MGWRVGDKLRVASVFGVPHFGIYIGQYGDLSDAVAHNAKFQKVEIVSLAAFAAGRPVFLDERIADDWWQASQIVHRALSLVGRDYGLFTFNCEHFVNYALRGEPVSPMVQGVLAVGFIGLLVAAGKQK